MEQTSTKQRKKTPGTGLKWKCGQCEYVFSSHAEFLQHRPTSGKCNYICKRCGQTFDNKAEYEMHLAICPNKASAPCGSGTESSFGGTTLGGQRWECPMCGATFGSNDEYEEHLIDGICPNPGIKYGGSSN